MKIRIFLLSILALAILFGSGTVKLNSGNLGMNNDRLDSIVNIVADSVLRHGNVWQFRYNKGYLMVITDQTNNRMRIVMPILKEKEMKKEDYRKCLIANYHSALDVKYALSDDLLWCVYIHPLRELADHQLKDAIDQVYTGALTYGGSYSSTNLVFGGGN